MPLIGLMKYHSPDPKELKRREQLHVKLQQTARTRRWMGYLALTTCIAGFLFLALGVVFDWPNEIRVLCGLANIFLAVGLVVQMMSIRMWEREQLGEEEPDVSWMARGTKAMGPTVVRRPPKKRGRYK